MTSEAVKHHYDASSVSGTRSADSTAAATPLVKGVTHMSLGGAASSRPVPHTRRRHAAFMAHLSAQTERLGQYRRLTDVDLIARRCFVNNSFDGILTMVGVIVGSFVSRLGDPRIILTTGLATCMAMGVSGGWGAFVSERAERRNQLQELEHAMLRNLEHTEQARASRFAVLVVTAVDGLSPLLSGALVLIPFMLAGRVIDMQTAYITSVCVALALLFGLGVFLGKVGRDAVLRSGLRMVVAGVVCVLLAFLLSSGSAG